uniref:Uncharacterized protein LOC108047766 n=1 Tax=Drosophila rhopaloa TaxID=1041015 RepID=A0A6P4EZM9_DRORH
MAFPHILVLLPLICTASALSLPNMTSTDAVAAGGGISPILVAGNPSNLGGSNISLSGGGGLAGSNPGGQSAPDSGGGTSAGGSPAGGSSGAAGSNSGISGSGNNSAMIQGQKSSQYEKCAGPGGSGSLQAIHLQSTTREPSTTESSMLLGSPYTQGPAQSPDGMGGAEGGDGTTPVPIEQRGPELTFAETGQGKTFIFAKNNTFIQMDGDIIQTFQLRLCREISFQFRTRLPHGLLVYHNVKNPDRIILDPYALYVIVEKGQLKVVHVFGKHSTSVTVGESLNRDEWHSVMVRIDVHGARLIARVDNSQEEVYLKGLNHEYNYGVSTNLPSVVLVGGLSSEEKLHGVKYITESFVGCIRNVVLSSGKAASDLLPIAPLVATKHENVNEGCSDMCESRHNLCFVGSRCINHYGGISCDCFGTDYEGEHCDIYTLPFIPKVDSHNPWVAPVKPLEQKASDQTVSAFLPYMPSPRLGKRSAHVLLRPIIYFDLAVRENNQFLGRLLLQLYTELSPEVVLEFVRMATHND